MVPVLNAFVVAQFIAPLTFLVVAQFIAPLTFIVVFEIAQRSNYVNNYRPYYKRVRSRAIHSASYIYSRVLKLPKGQIM